ncbi:ZIP family metal transporter [Marinobacter orientalis]|uniref:ZIP family metal transporter n=1 Tax=Marinobacter orientalis TaxID=1928859 RepID=A0A7Y0RDZ6_9GAMM|nr:ZIP family metal transporter [Marinobacter orientalis]NMT64484.1 ZIP family metal transporter [Marinobacter orientalis]TGX50557.1 ZIP family metal transporter [Marinobacter orientalis]
MLEEVNVVLLGATASLLAGLGTGVGALGVFLVRKLTPQLQDGMLSAAAGVMLAASFFSLLLPGIKYGEELTGATWSASLMVIAGLLMGAGLLFGIHQRLPHEHFTLGREGPESARIRRIWLFIIAIALHNFPEGMAVGVGFAGGDIGNGTALALGIGLQNIPEGLAVAVSLLAIEHSRTKSFFIAVLTGLLEPVGGLFGSAMVWLAEPIMPWTLGFAAGAMLFIISDEIIPETHRGQFKTLATFSLLGGFVVMMFLDATLG